MKLELCSLASGSSGNCYLIKSRNAAVLCDAGISCRRITNALGELGLNGEEIRGVFVTHEHSDHIKGIKTLSKKYPEMTVYMDHDMIPALEKEVVSGNITGTGPRERIVIEDIEITTFRLSHDARAPLGYSFTSEGNTITIITDTGCVTTDMQAAADAADILVIEANHDVNMLKMGPYPWHLKQRILSEEGHLSNESAGEAVAEALRRKGHFRQVILGHLSGENNFPEMAYQTVKNILEENGFYVGKHLSLTVAERDRTGDIIAV